MFVAVIDAAVFSEEGNRILDGLEAAHGITPEPAGPMVRRYHFSQFPDEKEAIGWLEAQSLTFRADAHEHVEFGVPTDG